MADARKLLVSSDGHRSRSSYPRLTSWHRQARVRGRGVFFFFPLSEGQAGGEGKGVLAISRHCFFFFFFFCLFITRVRPN